MRKGHIAWDATQVWERLFIGGLSDAEVLAGSNPHRITTVVSLSEIPVGAKRRGVNYLHLPIEDDERVSVHQFDRVPCGTANVESCSSVRHEILRGLILRGRRFLTVYRNRIRILLILNAGGERGIRTPGRAFDPTTV